MKEVVGKQNLGVKFADMADRISRVSGSVVLHLILPLWLLNSVNAVIMRYILNQPFIWVLESTTFIFGAYFVLGGAYCLYAKGHVAMDIFYERMRPWARITVDILTFLAILATCGLLFWFGGKRAWEATIAMETTQSLWQPILWPPLWAIPVGTILLIILALGNVIRSIQPLVTSKEIKT